MSDNTFTESQYKGYTLSRELTYETSVSNFFGFRHVFCQKRVANVIRNSKKLPSRYTVLSFQKNNNRACRESHRGQDV